MIIGIPNILPEERMRVLENATDVFKRSIRATMLMEDRLRSYGVTHSRLSTN